MNHLPQGWASAALHELFDFKYGKGLREDTRTPNGPVEVFGSNGVIGSHDEALTHGPTIIVGRKGSVGEVHLSRKGCWPIDTTYFIDTFPTGTPPEYWYFYLKSLHLGQQDKSSAIPGISRKDVYSIEIMVPPLAEQHRIAEKLHTSLNKMDTCQNRLDLIPPILKRFRQSVLTVGCSGRLTADWRQRNRDIAENEFEQTTVGAIANYVGGFAYKSPTFLKSGKHQVVRIGNVRPFHLKLDTSPVFVPEEIARQTERFGLLPDDIVISMTGTRYKQDYGFAAIVRVSDGKLFLNQRVAGLRCTKKILPKFLLYWLHTRIFREYFFAGETGNVNQGNVGADGIRQAPIELPCIAEQEEIVRRVEGLLEIADRIEARYAKAAAYLENITPSILAKAFRGELVPTEAELAKDEGRTFEDAGKLLARIRRSHGTDLEPDKSMKRTRERRAATN